MCQTTTFNSKGTQVVDLTTISKPLNRFGVQLHKRQTNHNNTGKKKAFTKNANTDLFATIVTILWETQVLTSIATIIAPTYEQLLQQ